MKAKNRTGRVRYLCQECGAASAKWLGRCPECGAWNRYQEVSEAPDGGRRSGAGSTRPVLLADVSAESARRLPTGIQEFDTVLGGGVVAGSLVLLGGDPGIGKSTLLMQAAFALAAAGVRVLYVSGEESEGQIRLRAARLGQPPGQLFLLCATDVDAVRAAAAEVKPAVVVIDSIQTMSHGEVASLPGSVAQVRECGAAMLALAKPDGPAVFLVGHVTKEGTLAGPRLLEHLVDTVAYFEGDRHHGFRVLRAVKNRFGATHEVGLFEMEERGLQEIRDPSRLFLQSRHHGQSGSALTVSLEGTRPLLLEVQALVTPTHFGLPQRRVSGLDYNRSCLLLAVLERRGGLMLGTQDVFLSVAGGMTATEPSMDLAAALAVVSSLRDQPLPEDMVMLGEVGLGGELRAVGGFDRRLREAARLGFTRCLVPRGDREASRSGPAPITCIEVEDIQAAMLQALPVDRGRSGS